MKIILDLCCGTGAWSKPYKNLPKRLFFTKDTVMTDEQILRCKGNNRKLISYRNNAEIARSRAITPLNFSNAFFKANP